MPELPEVYTTACFYHEMIEGKELLRIVDHTGKCSKNLESFKPGKVRYVTSEGKKIVIRISGKQYITVFLRMFGKFLPWIHNDKHHHMTFEFEDYKIYYCDTGGLGIGEITVCNGVEELAINFTGVGRDFIRREVTFDEWKPYASSRKSNIVRFLRDQKKFSGIGNYIVSESMYRARLSPERNMKTLDNQELRKLFDSIISVMRDAIESGGTTISDYVGPNGEDGKYVTDVYGRQKDKLGNRITKIKVDGRPIFYVESLQK